MATPQGTGINSRLGAPIRRSEIIERAESWLRPTVPYSTNKFHHNEFGIYRTDCSGYVSMAWGLSGVPLDRRGGLDTLGLAGVSESIERDDLRAGDILLRTEGSRLIRHVAIFHEWADDDGAAYWGFEQSGGTGTVHRLVSYPYDGQEHYLPRRYLNVIRY
jgi:cell wall-associated NlpC family hydrolase